jgi:hypothetical protein
MAFVMDDPGHQGRLVAAAAGTIHVRLSRPGELEFTAGYVQWVATEGSHRRKGLAEEVMMGLLGWFYENGVTAVELHATPMAHTLYQSMGFSDSGPRALRIRDLSAWRRADVDSFGRELARRLADALDGGLVGAYFVGSIALGGYVADESDVDVIGVSEHQVPAGAKLSCTKPVGVAPRPGQYVAVRGGGDDNRAGRPTPRGPD